MLSSLPRRPLLAAAPARVARSTRPPPHNLRRPRCSPPSATSNDATADAAEQALRDAAGADVDVAALGSPPAPRLPGARPFSVPLAIGLASAAFDAYYEAVGADPAAAWTDAAGVRVQYINAQALKAAATGVLTVTLASASGLAAADAWGTSDPYAVVRAGGCGHRSATVARSLTPTWGETFDLYVGSSVDRLTVSLFDADLLSGDDPLGEAVLPLADVVAGRVSGDVTLPLTTGDGAAAGAVTLTLSYAPLTDAAATARAAGDLGASDAAMEIARMTEAWRALASGVGDIAADRLFEPATFINAASTDTQAWIGFSEDLRAIVVAFRGTEMTSLADIVTDAFILPHGFDPAHPLPPATRASKTAAKGGAAPKGLWVHSGFFNAYASVRDTVWRVVDECMAAGGGGGWHLYVTGHSLGGALATLAAYEASFTAFASGTVSGLTMYNYGSPRVGNTEFATAFDAAVPDSWRVVNSDDVVARVPRAVGYRHVGHTVGIRKDGTFDAAAGVDQLEGESYDSVARSLASTVVSAVTEGDASALSETVAKEVDFAKAMMSGDALAQHKEALYFESLQKIVKSLLA